MKKVRVLFVCLIMLVLAASIAMAFEYPEGTLFRGITGHEEAVEFLQYQLFYAGYLGDDISEVDGIFGKKTEEAVKAFQRDHGEEANGIADPYIQSLLDEIWESSMEPQGGGEPYDRCYWGYDEHDCLVLVLCQRHQKCYDEVNALLDAAQDDVQIIEAFQSGITVWINDIDSQYQAWMDSEPEHEELIDNIRTSFYDYYRANLALWNIQYGSPSMAALANASDMLADHSVERCCQLGNTD